jgi:tRNA modification GTPase
MHDAHAETICAISSPLGEGGIGIVRMSGPAAHSILRRLFRPHRAVRTFASHRLYLGFITDPDAKHDIDEVFAVFMRAPRTYTREQMAEVYCHGGLAGQKRILELAVASGARLAEPGEFTKRAFLNGRIDLAQAESVLDIIRSETASELQQALDHTKGTLSERVNAVKWQIRDLLVDVEAHIDFPDEELGIDTDTWTGCIADALAPISALLASYEEGRATTQGLAVLIVGRTNVGKSSLLNALLRQERAIVTPLPGTTRDLIEETLHIKGIKFRITDTAGLRDAGNIIEQEGIARVLMRIPAADIILWVLDASQPYAPDDEGVYRALGDGRKVIAVLNKTDLPEAIDEQEVASKGFAVVKVSALNEWGLDGLKERLYEVFAGAGHQRPGVLVTNIRHRDAFAAAEAALHRAGRCAEGAEPLEFLAFELRDALLRLGEITGETVTDDILHDIFSKFCIGK